MTTPRPRLFSVGPARVLTRDGAGDEHLEMNVRNGKWPSLG